MTIEMHLQLQEMTEDELEVHIHRLEELAHEADLERARRKRENRNRRSTESV